jgi:hypothetical protein
MRQRDPVPSASWLPYTPFRRETPSTVRSHEDDDRRGYGPWRSADGRRKRWTSTTGSRPTTPRPTGPSTRRSTTDKILRPMTELTEELAAEFGEPKIFRPYRDVRFSADKTPYKTHIGAVVGGTGYLQLSAEGLAAGAGMWQMSPEQLARYRAAVADDRPGRRARGDHRRDREGRPSPCTATACSSPRPAATRRSPPDRPAQLQGPDRLAQWPVEPWLETPAAKDRRRLIFPNEPALWLNTHAGR